MATNNIQNDGTIVLNQPASDPAQAASGKEKKGRTALDGAAFAGAALGGGAAYAITQTGEGPDVGAGDPAKVSDDQTTDLAVENNPGSNLTTPSNEAGPTAGPDPVTTLEPAAEPGPTPGLESTNAIDPEPLMAGSEPESSIDSTDPALSIETGPVSEQAPAPNAGQEPVTDAGSVADSIPVAGAEPPMLDAGPVAVTELEGPGGESGVGPTTESVPNTESAAGPDPVYSSNQTPTSETVSSPEQTPVSNPDSELTSTTETEPEAQLEPADPNEEPPLPGQFTAEPALAEVIPESEAGDAVNAEVMPETSEVTMSDDLVEGELVEEPLTGELMDDINGSEEAGYQSSSEVDDDYVDTTTDDDSSDDQ